MTNASIVSILAHATPTPTSRSKGQKSKSRAGAYCGGNLAAQLVQLSIDYNKKFINWLRTSGLVSITSVATRYTLTAADFCADFQQRIIDRAINEWQSDCGAVSNAERQHSNTCCNC